MSFSSGQLSSGSSKYGRSKRAGPSRATESLDPTLYHIFETPVYLKTATELFLNHLRPFSQNIQEFPKDRNFPDPSNDFLINFYENLKNTGNENEILQMTSNITKMKNFLLELEIVGLPLSSTSAPQEEREKMLRDALKKVLDKTRFFESYPYLAFYKVPYYHNSKQKNLPLLTTKNPVDQKSAPVTGNDDEDKKILIKPCPQNPFKFWSDEKAGYSTVRATQGIFEGTIYFEVNLLTKRLEDQKENVKSSSSKNSPPSFAPQKDGVPHWRIGICQYQTDLLQPIGVDETSYALGDYEGKVYHKGRSAKYTDVSFGEGDTVGVLLHIPPTATADTIEDVQFVIDSEKKVHEKNLPILEYNLKLRHGALKGSFLAFFINGDCKGIAFTDLKKGAKYFPACSLYYRAGCEFNFGANSFKFAPNNSFEEFLFKTVQQKATTQNLLQKIENLNDLNQSFEKFEKFGKNFGENFQNFGKIEKTEEILNEEMKNKKNELEKLETQLNLISFSFEVEKDNSQHSEITQYPLFFQPFSDLLLKDDEQKDLKKHFFVHFLENGLKIWEKQDNFFKEWDLFDWQEEKENEFITKQLKLISSKILRLLENEAFRKILLEEDFVNEMIEIGQNLNNNNNNEPNNNALKEKPEKMEIDQ